MKQFTCPVSGKEFIEFTCTIHDRENPIRMFEYGDDKKSALAITLAVPVAFGTRHKIQPVDVVCFNETSIPKIVKMKLKSKAKVTVFARKDPKGLVIDSSDDISETKSV